MNFKNITEYKVSDFGKVGKATESAFTGKAVKSKGKADWTHHKARFEIKTGGGKVSDMLNRKALKVLYIPVPVVDDAGEIDLTACEGFYFESCADFIKTAESADMLAYHASNGETYIQVFWSVKDARPTSKKRYFRWLDALYENCTMTLEEFLEEQ